MADSEMMDDPKDLRDQRPDYVEDKSGSGDVDGEDLSEAEQPTVGTDPMETGSTDVEKPHVELDEDAVRQAEREGKGYR